MHVTGHQGYRVLCNPNRRSTTHPYLNHMTKHAGPHSGAPIMPRHRSCQDPLTLGTTRVHARARSDSFTPKPTRCQTQSRLTTHAVPLTLRHAPAQPQTIQILTHAQTHSCRATHAETHSRSDPLRLTHARSDPLTLKPYKDSRSIALGPNTISPRAGAHSHCVARTPHRVGNAEGAHEALDGPPTIGEPGACHCR